VKEVGFAMQDNKSGVQGVLTLNYNSHEEENIIDSSAAQLSAGDRDSVVLLQYNQQKEVGTEEYSRKESTKYSIDADKLISLIREYGSEMK
jgi:thiamine pyrophosphokinase